VDGDRGGLRISAPTDVDPDAERTVLVGEIRRVRLARV
jgi:hypothetical protein